MDYRAKILELVKQAPIQPTSLSKIINKDSLMASAMLSEMSSKGLLKISSLKVGSSPLYYSPEHPEHLLNYLTNLNDKDRQAVELLKDKKILRDSNLNPLQKVCMRNIKDFAMALDVNLGEKQEIFWKWYLVSDEEAEDIIKNLVSSVKEKPSEEKKQEKEVEEKPVFKDEVKDKPLPDKNIKEKPVPLPKVEETEQIKPVIPQKTAPPVFVDMGDLFLKKVKAFFDNNNITIHEVNTIRKKTEFDLVIEIPTPLGNLFYFCKAKNNKRISNSDLSNAFVQGQLKKLPVVFLSPGILTKPAKIFMKDLKGLTVTKL